MKILSVNDTKFKKYGKVLAGYDYSEIFEELKKIPLPESGIIYIASNENFESKKEKELFMNRGFGGTPIQIGCVCGSNDILNCLEYHKSSEFNIAMDDIILILGDERDIVAGKYNTEKCEAFFVPAGVGVELFGTTLHYAPMGKNNENYRMICVLPKGTNGEKVPFTKTDIEDEMCFGVNKWIMAHAEYDDDTIYKGLVGNNIKFSDLEE